MNRIIGLVCKAVTLAMGIAIVVLSILKEDSLDFIFFMAGIGLTCAGIVFFLNSKGEK